jgi:5'-methylthioadenosine phosphorylase
MDSSGDLVGIFGGSGFYRFLDGVEEVAVDTPYGPPSARIRIGDIEGRRVAFMPRHGDDHQLPAHRVNYRANLWALRHLGVRQVLGPCAVGSLRASLTPGTMVVPDQYVDRTWGREHTVYDEAPVVHVSPADPYCPVGRATILAIGKDVVAGGTMVVINGPRFSTRAESVWHASQGWSLVGMTGQPEAGIARELALCYTPIAMVTDHDAGIEGVKAVTHAEVLKIFASNLDRLKDLLHRSIKALPGPEPDDTASCSCRRALDGLELPSPLP